MIRIAESKFFGRNVKRLKKRYRSLDDDVERLKDELRENPLLGTDLGNGLRKVRMAIASKGKGKSHGARVITYTDALFTVEDGVVVLLTIYDKADRESISDKEMADLLEEL